MVKIGFIFGLLGLLLLANTCAAVQYQVSPDVKYANPGDTVTYGLTVNLTENDLKYPEFLPITEVFSVDNKYDNWVYSFSPDTVILDSSRTVNTSVLSVTVPLNATTGYYKHDVNATGYNVDGMQYGFPTSLDIYVVNTNVNNIPEFPSIALPAAAVLGLVAIFGRRKE